MTVPVLPREPGQLYWSRNSTTYRPEGRPSLHYRPPVGWMNDPNGLVFDRQSQQYHLFYQFHPYSCKWGPMHWGHAVSRDLRTWTHLPVALSPLSQDRGMAFSGSIVIDENNTSGLQMKSDPVFVAIFTECDGGENQRQSLAVSHDRGYTWERYPGNPVLVNPGVADFRDPKVFWHEESHTWIMTLARGYEVAIYSSANLIDWHGCSSYPRPDDELSGIWECPDLIPVKTIGPNAESKWAMIVSVLADPAQGVDAGVRYIIGDFDGHSFTPLPNQKSQWLDRGRDFYAFTSFSNLPGLGVAWMSNWQYAESLPITGGTRGQMTFPRQLVLHRDDTGYELRSLPYSAALGSPFWESEKPSWQEFQEKLDLMGDKPFVMTVSCCESEDLVFSMRSDNSLIQFGFRSDKASIFVDRRLGGYSFAGDDGVLERHVAPVYAGSSGVDLTIVVDRHSIEIFSGQAHASITDLIFRPAEGSHLVCETKDKPGVARAALYPEDSLENAPWLA